MAKLRKHYWIANKKKHKTAYQYWPRYCFSAAWQRRTILLKHKFTDTKNVILHVFLPVDLGNVNLKAFAIFLAHLCQKIPSIVVAEIPLVCSEVIYWFHHFGKFVLNLNHSAVGEILI